MKLSGRVVEGRIELEDDVPLPEGVSVEVTIADSTSEPYELTEEEDELLWQADQEIERGEYVTDEDFLAELRARRKE